MSTTADCWIGSSRPTAPKSMSPSVPSWNAKTLPGCGIGVEEAERAGPGRASNEQVLGERRAVDAGGVELRGVRDGEAVEPFLHEDAAGAQTRVDTAGTRTGRTLAEEQRHLVHGVGLAAEVELGPQAGGELLEHLARSHALPERGASLREVREQRERGEVALHDVGDAGPLHLDHHRLAGVQPGAVGLPDGGRGERLPVELGEHVVDAAAELGLEHRPDDLGRLRRNPVLQLGQLVGDVGRDAGRPGWRRSGRA